MNDDDAHHHHHEMLHSVNSSRCDISTRCQLGLSIMAASVAATKQNTAHSQLKGIVDFGKFAYLQSFQELDDKINTVSNHEEYQSFPLTQLKKQVL